MTFIIIECTQATGRLQAQQPRYTSTILLKSTFGTVTIFQSTPKMVYPHLRRPKLQKHAIVADDSTTCYDCDKSGESTEMDPFEPTPINEMGLEMPLSHHFVSRGDLSIGAVQAPPMFPSVSFASLHQQGSSNARTEVTMSELPISMESLQQAHRSTSSFPPPLWEPPASFTLSSCPPCPPIFYSATPMDTECKVSDSSLSTSTGACNSESGRSNLSEPSSLGRNAYSSSPNVEVVQSNCSLATEATSYSSEHDVTIKKKKRKNRPRKKSTPEDTASTILPALTPYNFFFRDERERLVVQAEHLPRGSSLFDIAMEWSDGDWSDERKVALLHKHWFRDRHTRRKHRKTNRNIDFTTYVYKKLCCVCNIQFFLHMHLPFVFGSPVVVSQM